MIIVIRSILQVNKLRFAMVSNQCKVTWQILVEPGCKRMSLTPELLALNGSAYGPWKPCLSKSSRSYKVLLGKMAKGSIVSIAEVPKKAFNSRSVRYIQ